MVNLFFIRHGRQNSTLCNVDVELSEEGRLQAEFLARRLKKLPVDALYSSDMLRAIQTAEILNKDYKLPLRIKKELREIDFGGLEGKSNEYIVEHYREFRSKLHKLKEDLPYPDGENGQDVLERAMPVIGDIVHSGKKNIVIVTHGGVIRVLLAALFGRNQAERFLFGVTLENTSITQMAYNPEYDRFYLERFNDYAHLEEQPELLRSSWYGTKNR